MSSLLGKEAIGKKKGHGSTFEQLHSYRYFETVVYYVY